MKAEAVKEAFLLVSARQADAARRRDDLRMEQASLEKVIARCQVVMDATLPLLCQACHGQGWIQVWYAQDDVKVEKCKACAGVGYLEDIYYDGAIPPATKEP